MSEEQSVEMTPVQQDELYPIACFMAPGSNVEDYCAMAEDPAILEFRPMGNPATPFFSPERDVVHVVPRAVAIIAESLRIGGYPKYLNFCLNNSGLTEKEFEEELSKFYNDRFFAAAEAATSGRFTTLPEAWFKLGWGETPRPVRMFLFAALGVAVFSEYFTAVRQLNQRGDSRTVPLRFISSAVSDAIRRKENDIDGKEETARNLRNALRLCRQAGMTDEEIMRVVND